MRGRGDGRKEKALGNQRGNFNWENMKDDRGLFKGFESKVENLFI